MSWLPSLWYSERVRAWLAQAFLLGASLALVVWVYDNTLTNLRERGIRVGFGFLARSANFPISESVLPYDPTDTFGWAMVVGVANTMMIAAITIALSTALGLGIGLARRSRHPLLSRAAGAYVTAIRNTPLIVQLLFFYSLVMTTLPPARQAFNPVAGVFISLRGVFLPGLEFGGRIGFLWAIAGLGAALLAAGMAWRRHRRRHPAGRVRRVWPVLAGAFGVAAAGLWLAGGLTVAVSPPRLQGFNFTGGVRLSSEFMALVVGFVIYTAAFIGEIIRGGIDAVDRGQWEAGRALGLAERKTLRLVIIPQALRIIVPPLTTQYLGTIKNTTLALAVGYPELGLVVGTVVNQTGQAIESIAIMMGVYLAISLMVALYMNWYNRKIALVRS